MKRDEIDDAIDAVVRQIMRTEPPAGLRARVMGQLSAPDRRPFMTLPRLAAAAAFAVCLVTGFVLTRDPPTVGEPPVRTVDVAATPSSTAPSTTRAAAPARIETPAGRVVVGAPVTRRGLRSAAGERLVSAMSIDETAAALPITPLKPMPSIEATPLIAPPVRINQLAISPLEMDPVRVDPLLSTPR